MERDDWSPFRNIWKETYIMFESTVIIAAAMVNEMKRNEDIEDRRAFYGPDFVPTSEEMRRKARLPRFLRRGANAA